MFAELNHIDTIRSQREAENLAESYRRLAAECDRKVEKFKRRELVDQERREAMKFMFRDIRATLTKDLFAPKCHTPTYRPNYPNFACVDANFKRMQRNWQAAAIQKRNNQIMILNDRGLSDARIGAIYKISKQRVQQIRTEATKKARISEPV